MKRPTALEQQANEYVQRLLDAAGRLNMRERPHVSMTTDDDGAVTVEWILSGRRVGFLVDPDSAESGWWAISSIEDGGPQTMGNMETFDAEALVRHMMGRKQ